MSLELKDKTPALGVAFSHGIEPRDNSERVIRVKRETKRQRVGMQHPLHDKEI